MGRGIKLAQMLYNKYMKLIANLSTNTWEKELEDHYTSTISVSIGFIKDGEEEVFFDNLSFGVTATNGKEKISDFLPKEDTSYFSTDQEIIHTFILTVGFDEKWEISVWAENSGEIIIENIEIITSKPKKIFESWVWSEELNCWVSPIPFPKDDKSYVWDEDTLNWIESNKN